MRSAGTRQARGGEWREVRVQRVQQRVPPATRHQPGAHTILTVQGGQSQSQSQSDQ